MILRIKNSRKFEKTIRREIIKRNSINIDEIFINYNKMMLNINNTLNKIKKIITIINIQNVNVYYNAIHFFI